MVCSLLSNNQSWTINSHISSVITQQLHNASHVMLRRTSFYEEITSQASTFIWKVRNFSFTSNFQNLSNFLQEQKWIFFNRKNQISNGKLSSFSQSRNMLLVSDKNPLLPHLNNINFSNLGMLSNTEKITLYIRLSQKSQHLFSQIRTFKTERNISRNSNSDIGVCQRMKDLLGLSNINCSRATKVKSDLESFHNEVERETLNAEHKQKLLMAFIKGYILARDSLVPQKSSWRWYHLVIGGVVVGFVFICMKKGNLSLFFKNSNLTIEVSESNVKFTDVKGVDEAKQELKNVVEFLKNPEKFSALGGKLPKGVLLVGPPGTGKTLLAKAVAGEAKVPFYSTSGPEFDEIYVGVGARRIRELFKLAKENIPCVIFIDEIDSIGKERTSSSLHPHANDTINQLLSEMDGFRNSGGIIVLGATNRKEDLDKALLRPGRFDVEVTVSVPDYTGRKELLDFYLKQVRFQSIDVERLARGTTNFTGADIENMVNQAALRAAVIGAQFVTMEHLEYARDKALMGPESLSKITDLETNRITAYHEGGHTVVAYFTENSQPLHKVTIIARGSSLGHTAYIPDKDIYHVTKSQLLAMLDSMMGGRAAEELVFGSEKITSGASSDLEKATDLASKMVRRWGMSEAIGLSSYSSSNFISPQTANVIDQEVKKLLQESYERAKNILIAHKDKHRELSEALLKYETLDAEEIAAIMKGDFVKKLKE